MVGTEFTGYVNVQKMTRAFLQQLGANVVVQAACPSVRTLTPGHHRCLGVRKLSHPTSSENDRVCHLGSCGYPRLHYPHSPQH